MKYFLVTALTIVMLYITSCTCSLAGNADMKCDPKVTLIENEENEANEVKNA